MNDLKRTALPLIKEELHKRIKFAASDEEYPVIATAVFVQLTDTTVITVGYAICKPEDEYDVEEGTAISIKRAIRRLARGLLDYPEIPLVRHCYAKAAVVLATEGVEDVSAK